MGGPQKVGPPQVEGLVGAEGAVSGVTSSSTQEMGRTADLSVQLAEVLCVLGGGGKATGAAS